MYFFYMFTWVLSKIYFCVHEYNYLIFFIANVKLRPIYDSHNPFEVEFYKFSQIGFIVEKEKIPYVLYLSFWIQLHIYCNFKKSQIVQVKFVITWFESPWTHLWFVATSHQDACATDIGWLIVEVCICLALNMFVQTLFIAEP